jgi:hypothetical protein
LEDEIVISSTLDGQINPNNPLFEAFVQMLKVKISMQWLD